MTVNFIYLMNFLTLYTRTYYTNTQLLRAIRPVLLTTGMV